MWVSEGGLLWDSLGTLEQVRTELEKSAVCKARTFPWAAQGTGWYPLGLFLSHLHVGS